MSVDQEARPIQIAEPGVYDLTDVAYHSDPVPGGSLSSTGARKLLPPSCPALFKHERDHGRPPKREFDFGHAAHLEVLGTGARVEVVPGDRWDTKAAKEKVAEIRERGDTPLRQGDYDQVQAMAAVLRAHPIAAALLRPEVGTPEQSLFWVDDDTQVWRRARLDWLPNQGRGRFIVADYKTAKSAAPDDIAKTVHAYGYHQQAAFYLDGIKALGLAADPLFVFIVQMKTAPYLVTVVELAESALLIGRDLNRRALRLYRDCLASGHWPGHSEDVELIALPAWAERAHFAEESTRV